MLRIVMLVVALAMAMPVFASDYLIETTKRRADSTIFGFSRTEDGDTGAIFVFCHGSFFAHEMDDWTIDVARRALEEYFHPPSALKFYGFPR